MGKKTHILNCHGKKTRLFLIRKENQIAESQYLVQVYCFGTCITFLIIIGDQVLLCFLVNSSKSNYYDSLTEPLQAWLDLNSVTFGISTETSLCQPPGTKLRDHPILYFCCSVILILPLCYSKTIDFLQYVSMAGE